MSRRPPRTGQGRGRARGRGGASVTLRYETKLQVDPKAAMDAVVPLVTGEILRQNDQGIDAEGRTFKPYSPAYKKTLAAMGEDPSRVDHRVTGRMLGSLGERRRRLTKTGGTVWIGPSAAFAVIGAALQRLRLWLGLAPKGRKRVAKALSRAGVFKSKRAR